MLFYRNFDFLTWFLGINFTSWTLRSFFWRFFEILIWFGYQSFIYQCMFIILKIFSHHFWEIFWNWLDFQTITSWSRFLNILEYMLFWVFVSKKLGFSFFTLMKLIMSIYTLNVVWKSSSIRFLIGPEKMPRSNHLLR